SRSPVRSLRVAGRLEPADVAIDRRSARSAKTLGFRGGRLLPTPLLGATIGKRNRSAVPVPAGRTIRPVGAADAKDPEIAVINTRGAAAQIIGIGLFVQEKQRIRWAGTTDLA